MSSGSHAVHMVLMPLDSSPVPTSVLNPQQVKRELRWQQRLTEITTWMDEHEVLPNMQSKDELESALGVWLRIQRTALQEGKLTAERHAKLIKVPTVAEYLEPGTQRLRAQQVWSKNFAEFTSFVKEHGRTPSMVPGESELGRWWNYQQSRRESGKLSPEQERLIDEALSVLPARADLKSRQYDEKWQAVFADFEAWVQQHGIPRRRTDDKEEYRLANWLNVQRLNGRGDRLWDEHREQLSKYPGALDTVKAEGVQEWARAVASFYGEHGRLPKYTRSEGRASTQLAQLRKAAVDGRIPDQVLAELEGVPWDPRPLRTIGERLQELEEHVERHGKLPADEYFRRWTWRMAGKFSEEATAAHERITELRKLHPKKAHPTPKRLWLRRCSELKDLVDRQGRLPLSRGEEQSRYYWCKYNLAKLNDRQLGVEKSELLKEWAA